MAADKISRGCLFISGAESGLGDDWRERNRLIDREEQSSGKRT